ncbi:MAG: internalin [Thermosipho sp. (in: thermotogales)]|nr:internalin [Thermosipho sp. (in: thermotogales)]
MLNGKTKVLFIFFMLFITTLIWSSDNTNINNNPPNVPNNPMPLNGSTKILLSPILSWQSNDPDGDTLIYDIYFGTEEPLNLIAFNFKKNKYRLGVLKPGTTYYWKIVVKDGKGGEKIGPVWSFKTVEEDATVNFANDNLEKAIREQLNKLSGDITVKDMLKLTYLDASKSEISNLFGLEYAVNLEVLILSDNNIKNISPISNLINLHKLDLSGNEIIDLTPISELVNLQWLNFSNNRIYDLSPITNLNNLQWLKLYNNNIKSVTPLSGMNSLRYLDLEFNAIISVKPLLKLPNLEYLNIRMNDLNLVDPESENMKIIEELIKREVVVYY